MYQIIIDVDPPAPKPTDVKVPAGWQDAQPMNHTFEKFNEFMAKYGDELGLTIRDWKVIADDG